MNLNVGNAVFFKHISNSSIFNMCLTIGFPINQKKRIQKFDHINSQKKKFFAIFLKKYQFFLNRFKKIKNSIYFKKIQFAFSGVCNEDCNQKIDLKKNKKFNLF